VETSGGTLTARRTDNGAHVTLSADYVAESVDLGYAMTAHRAHGSTVTRAHVAILTSANLSRELFYVAMTRGTDSNLAWVAVPETDPDKQIPGAHLAQPTALGRVATVVATTGAERSAHRTAADEHDRTHSLSRLTAEAAHLDDIAREPVPDSSVAHARAFAAARFGPPPADHEAAGSHRALVARLAFLHARGYHLRRVVDDAIAARPVDGAGDLRALVTWRLSNVLGLPTREDPLDMATLGREHPELAHPPTTTENDGPSTSNASTASPPARPQGTSPIYTLIWDEPPNTPGQESERKPSDVRRYRSRHRRTTIAIVTANIVEAAVQTIAEIIRIATLFGQGVDDPSRQVPLSLPLQ